MKPEEISTGENGVPMFCMISQDLGQSIKEIVRDCGWGKNSVCVKNLRHTVLGEIQELTDTTQEELTKNVMAGRASQPVPDHEHEDVEAAAPGRVDMPQSGTRFAHSRRLSTCFVTWTLL